MSEQYPRRITKNLLKNNVCKNCSQGCFYSTDQIEHWNRENHCSLTGILILETDTCELFEKPEQEMAKDEFIQRLNGEWYK